MNINNFMRRGQIQRRKSRERAIFPVMPLIQLGHWLGALPLSALSTLLGCAQHSQNCRWESPTIV
eukprot:2847749-Amphidinium_carterae.1